VISMALWDVFGLIRLSMGLRPIFTSFP